MQNSNSICAYYAFYGLYLNRSRWWGKLAYFQPATHPEKKYPIILCKVIRDTLQSNTYYLGKYHVILFSLSFSSLSFSLG